MCVCVCVHAVGTYVSVFVALGFPLVFRRQTQFLGRVTNIWSQFCFCFRVRKKSLKSVFFFFLYISAQLSASGFMSVRVPAGPQNQLLVWVATQDSLRYANSSSPTCRSAGSLWMLSEGEQRGCFLCERRRNTFFTLTPTQKKEEPDKLCASLTHRVIV